MWPGNNWGLHLPVWLRFIVMTGGGDWWVSGRHAMSCLWQRSDTAGEIPHVVTVRDLWWVMLGGVDRGAGNCVTHHHTGHCVGVTVWQWSKGDVSSLPSPHPIMIPHHHQYHSRLAILTPVTRLSVTMPNLGWRTQSPRWHSLLWQTQHSEGAEQGLLAQLSAFRRW